MSEITYKYKEAPSLPQGLSVQWGLIGGFFLAAGPTKTTADINEAASLGVEPRVAAMAAHRAASSPGIVYRESSRIAGVEVDQMRGIGRVGAA